MSPRCPNCDGGDPAGDLCEQCAMTKKNIHAVALGRLGGQQTSNQEQDDATV